MLAIFLYKRITALCIALIGALYKQPVAKSEKRGKSDLLTQGRRYTKGLAMRENSCTIAPLMKRICWPFLTSELNAHNIQSPLLHKIRYGSSALAYIW